MPAPDPRQRWLHLAPHTTRFFRLGEELEAGTLLGVSAFGGRVEVADQRSRVVDVWFDVWDERVTLVLEPAPAPCKAGGAR